MSKKIIKSKKLPNCDKLFEKFFAHELSKDAFEYRGFPATLPDMIKIPNNWGSRAPQFLKKKYLSMVRDQIKIMTTAAEKDHKAIFKIKGPIDLRWIDKVDKLYDRTLIREIIDEKGDDNTYAAMCCEFGAAIGKVLKKLVPRLQWVYEIPYWDSALYDPKSRTQINVFHWGIKKMSEDGVDDGYKAKIRAAVKLLSKK